MPFTKRTSIINKLLNEGALSPVGRALDLGCGKGYDTNQLYDLGFDVDAVDKNPEYMEWMKGYNRIHGYVSKIEDFVIKPEHYNLIIASLSLHFITDKTVVAKVIENMVSGSIKNGIIIFTLIGDRNESTHSSWSTWKEEEILLMLAGLPVTVRNFNDIKGIGSTTSNGLRYWHKYEIVLVKK